MAATPAPKRAKKKGRGIPRPFFLARFGAGVAAMSPSAVLLRQEHPSNPLHGLEGHQRRPRDRVVAETAPAGHFIVGVQRAGSPVEAGADELDRRLSCVWAPENLSTESLR